MENRFELDLSLELQKKRPLEKNTSDFLKLETISSVNSELESLLQSYWPNTGQHFYKNIVESEGQICYSLVRTKRNLKSGSRRQIIGFARLRPGLQKCKTSGRVGVLSYVIISSEERGAGFGKFLVDSIETELTKTELFHYIYLEAESSRTYQFYEKLGYIKSEKGATAKTRVLKDRNVSKIENLFSNRMREPENGVKNSKMAKIWMRKRIIFECAERIDGSIIQIGPCCGLASLLIALDGFLEKSFLSLSASDLKRISENLYISAKEIGMGFDGEIFDAKKFKQFINKHVSEIINQAICYSMKSHENIKVFAVLENIEHIRKYWQNNIDPDTVLVPFDCGSTNRPDCLQGRAAHWGLIVGSQLSDKCGSQGKLEEKLVVLKHSKTKLDQIVTVESIIKSNLQLDESDSDVNVFGGSGLKGRCIKLFIKIVNSSK